VLDGDEAASQMSDDGAALELALVGVLILLNGFFAAAEIAIVSARRSRLQALAEEGRRGALAALRLKADLDRFLATVQIGVTVVSTLASTVGGVAAIERLEPLIASLGAPWARQVAEPAAVGIVVLTIAYLSLVVGELVPKSLAVRNAEALAVWVAPVIEALSRVSRAAVAALTASSRLCLRLLGHREASAQPFHTLEDLRAIAEEAQDQGVVHGHLVAAAVGFHDRQVREVLTPRIRIRALPVDADLRQAVKTVRESGHSRFPVYREVLDDAVGFVYARDIYAAALDGVDVDLATLVRQSLVVPLTKAATALLAEMRKSGIPMALAVDEHGTLAGLVTIEDLVEVIVGEIRDEHAGAHELVTRLPGGVIEAEGSTPLHELNEDEGLDLPESSDYVTLAGLILERLGSLPRPGEAVEIAPYVLTVLRVDDRRVSRVRIAPLEVDTASVAGASPVRSGRRDQDA
jgi:putative hemolysin